MLHAEMSRGRLVIRTLVCSAAATIALLASCKVFDPTLVDDGGDGSKVDAGECEEGAAEVCNGRDDNCDLDVDEGFELQTDLQNCGECGRECTFANAGPGECSAGECVNTCDEGWDDCNGDTVDGCEANLTSRSSCTGCNLTCPFACSETGCVNGSTLAAGRSWSCATFSNGSARCWGSNASGQLGTGDTMPSISPREVVELSDAQRIFANFGHTCALRAGKIASCWGENDRGQLGDGTTAGRTQPVPVILDSVDQIAVGLAHTCVRSGDRLYCWGFNDSGQLGFGDLVHRTQPTLLPTKTTGDVVDVAVGVSHTCAVQLGGSVLCWGYNDQGQAGAPGANGGGEDRMLTPVTVPSVDNAVKVALGHAHSCAITTAGKVRCWGWNAFGQLGDGGFSSRSQPLFVIDDSGADLDDVTRLVAGAKRTCAIREDGAAFCWGDNTLGSLGSGPTPAETTHATRVTALGEENVIDVAVGEDHTCFLGPTRIRCVGENQQGQLGDGSTAASTSGVDVEL